MGKLFAPTGAQIIGTLDKIPGVAGILDVTRKLDGSFNIEHDSDTAVDWDGQETEKDPESGDRLFVDEHDIIWLERLLTYKESEDA